MPVSKPSTLPRFASNSSGIATAGKTVEPTELKKTSGWAPGEKPPAEYLNWLFWLIFTWIRWLDDIAAQAFVWTGLHEFQAGVKITSPGAQGQCLLVNRTTDGNAIVATAGPGTGVAISGATNGAGIGVQAIAGTASAVAFNTLLTADSTTGMLVSMGNSCTGFNLFSAGTNCTGVKVSGMGASGIAGDFTGGSSGIGVKGKVTTGTGVFGESLGAGDAGKFLNASTGRACYITRTGASTAAHALYAEGYSNGVNANGAAAYFEQLYTHGSGWTKRAPAIVIGQGSLHFAGSQPTRAQSPGLNNTLCGTNILKAWGRVTIGDGSVTIIDGYNIKDITIAGGGFTTNGVVEFELPMADDKYSVTWGSDNITHYPARNSTKDENGFNFNVMKLTTMVAMDFADPATATIDFHVYGRQ